MKGEDRAMTVSASELADLLSKIAGRDRAAFAALYRATSPKLYGVVSRILPRGDAGEVLQEAYVKIWDRAADFDPAKEANNLSKHGISLARWIDIDMKITFTDSRRDYGEIRYRGYGYIDGLAYCLVFTDRNGRVRPISLRRAHNKEMRRHVP